jgi:plastocyanin
MRRRMIALALATALLAGCGGDDEEPATTPEPAAEATEAPADSGGGEAVKVSSPADGSLKFDQATLTAKAGKVTFTFSNPSQVPHAFEVEGSGVEEETDTITEGEASVTVDLKAGSYEYYCPVGQHRAAGMEGTLTVE